MYLFPFCHRGVDVHSTSTIHAQVYRSNALMVLNLGLYLIRDSIRPGVEGQVQVVTKYTRERFGFDEGLVQVPDETVTYSVRVRLEFDADRDEGCRLFGVELHGFRGSASRRKSARLGQVSDETHGYS
jgi:hypothetical protein